MLPLAEFYLALPEPTAACMMAVSDHILATDPAFSAGFKYRLPSFDYRGRFFCYLWIDKKNGQPYLGFMDGMLIDHPALASGDRKRVKVLALRPDEDLPIDTITEILQMATALRDEKKKK